MEMKEEIEIISEVEAIRTRPTMYVGDLSEDKLTMMLKEVLCIAVEENVSGRCNEIKIELSKDRTVKVKENGSGISMEIGENQIPYAESLLTQLYGCRQAKRNKDFGRRICGVGIAVVNALSEYFAIENNWNGEKWFQEYNYGNKVDSFKFLGYTNDKGTEISFRLDTNILKADEIDVEELRLYFQYLSPEIPFLKVEYSNLLMQVTEVIFCS